MKQRAADCHTGMPDSFLSKVHESQRERGASTRALTSAFRLCLYRHRYRRRYHEVNMTALNNLLRGSLELLILKALSLEPLHGVGIARRIEQITNGSFQVSFGSLFPALHRMEENGWLKADWAM